MARKQKKLVKIVWIIITIMITFTMILFTAGAPYLTTTSTGGYGF